MAVLFLGLCLVTPVALLLMAPQQSGVNDGKLYWLAGCQRAKKNVLVPQAHNAKMVRFGTGSLPEERDLEALKEDNGLRVYGPTSDELS